MEVNDDVVSRRSARLRSAAKVMLRTPYAAQALRALSVRNVYPATSRQTDTRNPAASAFARYSSSGAAADPGRPEARAARHRDRQEPS
jgi:hypothetical protein